MALTDSSTHTPMADYNTDIRPGLGLTYADVVFGETVRQLSNIGSNAADDDMYSHCRSNADGTLYMRYRTQLDICYTADATVYKSAQNAGTGNDPTDGGTPARINLMFHPTDPDKYFFLQYTSSRGLYQRNLAAGTNTLVTDPGFNLGSVGGTTNWCDKIGRLFLLKDQPAGNYRVYDRTNNVIYTGNIPLAGSGGWAGITPDGKYVLSSRDGSDYTISYAITLGNPGSVNTTGVKFCRTGSGHSLGVSASDGKNYLVLHDAENGNLYAMDVTTDNNGHALGNLAGQGGVQLLVHNANNDIHITHGPLGSGQDWVFIALESGQSSGADSDDFNAIPGTNNTWYAYKSEIIAVNVVTQARRRLAHHRSRGIPNPANAFSFYYWQPRLSCSWDSSFVFWASNMNDSTPNDYADLYGIANPLGAGGGGSALLQESGWYPTQAQTNPTRISKW